jgi:urease accessory protein
MISADYLRAVQYLSPAFPIGSFAYSGGLETAIDQGDVWDADTLQAWILAAIWYGSARCDAILMAHARTGCVQKLTDLAYALAPSAERSLELREMGRAYASLMASLNGAPFANLPLPVAVGHSMQGLKIPTEDILTLWLQGFAAQLVSVGVRYIPLGQSAGQAVLAGLGPDILRSAQTCALASLDDIATASIGADMASMRHETQTVRIYRT